MEPAVTVCVVSGPSGRGGLARRGAHLGWVRVGRCRSRRHNKNLKHERESLERTCRRDPKGTREKLIYAKSARGERGCAVAHRVPSLRIMSEKRRRPSAQGCAAKSEVNGDWSRGHRVSPLGN